tara:strand:- start:2078 stop:2365 length:288 start_codon:yes stop_codon:yes gene_type:complete
MDKQGSNMRKSSASIQFSGMVRLRSGAPRTIAGVTYRPGVSYSPDDPGVVMKPLFFLLAPTEQRTAPPKTKPATMRPHVKPAPGTLDVAVDDEDE